MMVLFQVNRTATLWGVFLVLFCARIASAFMSSSSCTQITAASLNLPRFKSIPSSEPLRQHSCQARQQDPLSKHSYLAASTTVTNGETAVNGIGQVEKAESVICGGGPAGLLAAIMLADKFPSSVVRVYDRLPEPPNADDATVWQDFARFYLIGIGGRGQRALKRFGVWDGVAARSVAVVGRKDWPPDNPEGVERIFTEKDKRVPAQVLPRDKLVGVLHQSILEKYQGRIELNYGYEVQPLDFEYNQGSSVLLQVTKCASEKTLTRQNPAAMEKTTKSEETADDDFVCNTEDVQYLAADFVVAADGTVRTIANAMEALDKEHLASMKNPIRKLLFQPFRVKRYVDDNQRIYKTVPMKVPDGWRSDINYSARTKEGRVNYDALPANANGDFCGVLLLRKGDPLAEADTDPAELRKLLDDTLPQFSVLLDDETVTAVAKKPVSYLPGFRYAGPRLNQGDRCLIIGDSAHTVKPYFGLGANSALEDVVFLSDIMDEHGLDIPKSVQTYSRRRAPEAKALVRISRDLDRPGKLGFLTFILPLILDSIFAGLAPKLFAPNVISMLQKETITFAQVARRKRMDRALQVSILVGGLSAMAWTCLKLLSIVASYAGKKRSTVALGLAATGLALKGVSSLAQFLVPGLAPADVLVRLSSRVTNSRTHLTPLRKLKTNDKKEVANGESFLTPLKGYGNKRKNSEP